MEFYKIEKDVPIQNRVDGSGRHKKECRIVIEKMEIGDSIFIPTNKRHNAYTAAMAVGIKIAARKVDDKVLRVWRIK